MSNPKSQILNPKSQNKTQLYQIANLKSQISNAKSFKKNKTQLYQIANLKCQKFLKKQNSTLPNRKSQMPKVYKKTKLNFTNYFLTTTFDQLP